MTRGRLFALVALAVAATSACAARTAPGPAEPVLGLGQGEHRICVPAPKGVGEATMFGDTWVTHEGDEAVTIKAAAIRYEDSRGRRQEQETVTVMLVSHRPCQEVLEHDGG